MSNEPLPQPFLCIVDRSKDIVWVRPVGDFDLHTSAQVDAQLHGLRTDGYRAFVVDLRRTAFIDSSGVNTLVNWHHRSQRDGFSFAAVEGPRPVQRVFHFTGVDQVLRFVDGD
jgi:anti-anti-sigma factor